MFDWRRKGNGRNPQPENVLPFPVSEVPRREPKTYYTVGTNDDGDVVLRLGEKYATTLTMNPSACRHLIRMLETALGGE